MGVSTGTSVKLIKPKLYSSELFVLTPPRMSSVLVHATDSALRAGDEPH